MWKSPTEVSYIHLNTHAVLNAHSGLLSTFSFLLFTSLAISEIIFGIEWPRRVAIIEQQYRRKHTLANTAYSEFLSLMLNRGCLHILHKVYIITASTIISPSTIWVYAESQSELLEGGGECFVQRETCAARTRAFVRKKNKRNGDVNLFIYI